MKAVLHLPSLALLLVSSSVTAIELPTSEPTKCYEIAWGSPGEQAQGLTAGQAITLCSGATDAQPEYFKRFVKAWANQPDGGLGLTAAAKPLRYARRIRCNKNGVHAEAVSIQRFVRGAAQAGHPAFGVGRRLTPPSSGRPKGRFAPFAPPLMSNVRSHRPTPRLSREPSSKP